MSADEPRTAIVSALVAKRAEIAGLIGDLQKKIQGYQDALVHLDHALRLFDPTISGWDIRAKRPKARMKGYFQHGELSRRTGAACPPGCGRSRQGVHRTGSV
jgi:hypothetical protein